MSDVQQKQENGFSISIITEPDCLKTIKMLDWYYGDEENVEIPDGINMIGRHAFYCLNSHEMKLWFDAYDGKMHMANHTPLKSLKIPSSVSIINGSAICNCDDLEAIYFANKDILIIGDIDDRLEDCEPRIIKIADKDITLEDLDFLKKLKERGMSFKKLESCSEEIRLLIETDEL